MSETDEKSGIVGGETAVEGAARYCRGCGYNLQALTEARCPECGRGFDPGDRRSTLRRPLQRWTRWVWRMGYAVLAVILLLAALWGWFYWGWYDEQQALGKLRGVEYVEAPISPWLRKRLGSSGFVLDRVDVVVLGPDADPREFGAVARLTRLERLDLKGTPVRDLQPLAGLAKLRHLYLCYTPVTDLRPLVELPKLEELFLESSMPMDVTPLARCKRLRRLCLNSPTVTAAEVEALRREMPDCKVNTW